MKITFPFLFAVVLCLGCAQDRVQPKIALTAGPRLVTRSARPAELVKVNSIMILPLALEVGARSLEMTKEGFEQELANSLNTELGLKLIETNAGMFKAGADLTVLPKGTTALAKKLGADAILWTRVHSFEERVGSALGASETAHVSFTMSLLSTVDGHEMWQASYHFKDEPLSEDLFGAKQQFEEAHGPKFQAANEVIRRGFKEASRDLALKRTEQFRGFSG